MRKVVILKRYGETTNKVCECGAGAVFFIKNTTYTPPLGEVVCFQCLIDRLGRFEIADLISRAWPEPE